MYFNSQAQTMKVYNFYFYTHISSSESEKLIVDIALYLWCLVNSCSLLDSKFDNDADVLVEIMACVVVWP